MLNRTLAKYLFYMVAVILFTWTASLTVSFIQSVLPNSFWAVPYLALVVFDGGLIAWMFVFLSHAQGNIQRATALILTIVNLLGVGLMVIAEILLDGQTLTAAPESLGTVAVWAIGIWTIINVAGVVLFHLGDNEARKEMAIQSEKDAIFEGALTALKNRRIAAQQGLANEMSATMFAQLLSDIRADSDKNGIPDLLERGQQSGPRITSTERPQLTAEQAAQVAAFLSLAQPVDTGNSTHAAPRHDTTAAPPQAGQGQPNGPATKPLGRTGDGRP